MKARLMVMFVLAFLLIQSAQGATLAFNGWLKNGESATTEKESFLIQIGSSGKEVWADYGAGSIKVANNSCDQTQTAKVCVDNVEYLLIERRYRAFVRIFSLAPKITLTRTFANTNLIVGNDTVVTIKIENSGDVAATEVSYIEPLTDDIEVLDINGGLQEDGKIIWNGVIKAGETKEITYRIRPLEIMDRKFSSHLSYFDGFEIKTITSSEINLKATPFVLMTSKIVGRADIYIGEIFNYTANITNLDSRAVDFDFFEIKLDRGLEVVELPFELEKSANNIYRYENWKLIQNKSKAFRFKIKGKLVSESNIYANAEYKGFDKAERKLDEIKSSVKVTDKGVAVKTNLNEKIIEEGEIKKISIIISNNNPAAKITDVFASTDSELVYLPNAYFAEMEASSSKRIEKTFKVPKISAQRGYKINVNITYKTEFGESGSKIITDTVTAIPVKDLVITQTTDKTEIESNEQVLVKVKIENPRLVRVNQVSVKSIIPEEMTLSGAATNTVNIYSKESVNALSFFATAPKVRTATKYNITTEVSYSDGEKRYNYAASSGITVKPKDIKLELTKSVSETDIYEGEPFYVAYSVKNPSEDQEARNVAIKFPLQQEFDLLGGKREHYIEQIGAGEIVYIYTKEKVRAKYNTTLSLGKTTAYYQNQDGANFSANSTELSLRIKTAYKKGPYIILEKEAPETANNLESFKIRLKIKNIGDDYANVDIEDLHNKWSVFLDKGAEKTFEYSTKITAPGKQEIPQATAFYSYGNSTYITGSNKETINIENKPLISLERIMPEEGNNIDNIKVELKAKNILGKELENITITDSGREWNFGQLQDEATLSYTANFTEPGAYTLDEATASYIFDGQLFKVSSEKSRIAIAERKILRLEKSAPSEVKGGEEFNVIIKATNLGELKIEAAVIKDGDTEFVVSIVPGEEKTASYNMTLEETTLLGEAGISYRYLERNFQEYSNTANVIVKGKINATKQEIKEEKPKGIMGKILDFFRGIVTWKRK